MVALVDVRRLTPRTDAVLADPRLAAAEHRLGRAIVLSAVRRAQVATLTRWNDQAGRARAEVTALVDRAISATIMDLMSVPNAEGVPARCTPAGTADR